MEWIRSRKLSRTIITVLLMTMTVWLLPAGFMAEKAEAAVQIDDPVIRDSSQLTSGQKVTWDCVWFGSYPQSEVVCETDTDRISELTGGSYENQYVTVSNAQWNKITGASYNNYGDATVDGVKYRRLSKTDAVRTASGSSSYYEWGDDTVRYFRYEPIKWRVLDVNGNDALLVADKALDDQKYNTTSANVTWETCTMRSWLNAYDSSCNSYGRDYSKLNFINYAFTSSERGAIKTTEVVNDDNISYGTEGGNNTSDKIFLLSENEVYNTNTALSYGFAKSRSTYDEARRCKSSTYAKAMGAYSSTDSSYAGNCWWWLRSPGNSSDNAAHVDYHGYVYSNSYDGSVNYTGLAARPALHLNLSSSNLYSYAGTVSNDGTVNEEGGGAVTPDNPDTEETYKPVSKVDLTTAADSGEIKLFTDASGTVDNKNVTKVYPGDYKLNLGATKTTVSRESQGDGTYKIKVAIGIVDDGSLLNSAKKWENLKNDVEKARSNLNKAQNLNTFMKKWGQNYGTCNIVDKFKVKPKISVAGYYEALCDENGRLISDKGGAVVDVKWKASHTQQTVTLPIPIPYYVELSGGVNAKGNIGISGIVGETGLEVSGSLNINPNITAGCAAGVKKLASIGIEGSADLAAQVYPPTKGTLTAALDVKATVLTIEYNWNLASAEYALWDTTGENTASVAAASALKAQKASVMSRAFQAKTTEWDGDSVSRLQNYVLPQTVPVMAAVDDKIVMVFTANDEERAAVDCTKLMYSVYDGSEWSEPEAVYDNGAADNYADIKIINGSLYAAWQKCKSEIKADTAAGKAEEMAQKSEICVSRFDSSTGKFTDSSFVTDNSTMDAAPCLIDKSGTPAVAWLSNDADDLFMAEGNNTINSAELADGKWTKSDKKISVKNTLTDLKALYDGENYRFIYMSTADGDDGETVSNVYMSDASGEFADISGAESTLAGLSCSNDAVYWTQDGTLTKYDVKAGSTSEITAGDAQTISPNVTPVSVGDKTALLWMTNDEEGCKFYSSVKTSDGYSEPVEIYSKANVKGNYYTAVLGDDGSWDVIFSGTSMKNSDKTSIFFFSKEDTPKAELDSIVINESEAENSVQPIAYTVKNESETDMKSFTLTVKNEDETVLEKEVTCDIAPGESAYFEDSFKLASEQQTSDITVQTVAAGQTDTKDASMEEQLINTDLSLDVKKETDGKTVKFTAVVTNTGEIDAGGKIEFYSDSEKKTLVSSKTVDSLAPGATAEFEFSMNMKDAVYNDDDVADFTIAVTADVEEQSTENNEYYGVLYKWENTVTETYDIGDAKVTGITDKEYTGKVIKQDITVTYGETELKEGTDYSVEYSDNTAVGSAKVTITGMGDYTGSIVKTFKITKKTYDIGDAKVTGITDKEYTGKVIKQDITVTYGETELKEGTDYSVEYSDNTAVGSAKVTITGKGDYTGSIVKTFKITKKTETEETDNPVFGDNSIVRIAGSNRYATSNEAADALKKSLGVDKFENIIVASGADYPDALAGSYLAKVKNAPVMLVGKDADTEADVKQYISNNLKAGGTVYLLGGTGVVTSRFETGVKKLKDSDDKAVNVERLGGASRYETNIAILKAAGISADAKDAEDLLVCTGEGFADSLSASAVGKPILLVAKAGLNSTQKNYLKSIGVNDVYLIGGTGVVSESIGTQMKAYDQDSKCERVAGSNRYLTSVAVAKKFFPDGADSAVLAYAHNFPDGLAGGPLALSIKAPLLLVDSSAAGYSDAAAYAEKAGIKKAAVLGGKTLITDSAVKNIIQ